jgi:6-phosphofructokinase 1
LGLKQQYPRPLKPYDAPRYLQSFTFTAAFHLLSFNREKVEASCTPDGVGIVRLMGRHAGFIAAHAALASGDVDLVLIPEDTQLQWHEVIDHIRRTLASSRNHCVILLAEGWTSRFPL